MPDFTYTYPGAGDIITLPAEFAGYWGNGSPTFLVPNASTKILVGVINATWNLGNTKSAEANARLSALTDANGLLDPNNAPHVTAGSVDLPSVTAPGVNIPANIDSTQIMSMFDTKYLELVELLSDKFTAFRSTYFPDESATYNAAEQWIQESLENPNSGIPLAVQAQILGDDHARINAEKQRAQDDVFAQFAARGFPIPPDVATSAMMQIGQKAQDEMAESSRKVAILSVDMMKFSVEKAINLRGLALDAAVKYVTALALGPDMASKLIGVGYDAQSKLISAASSFYSADTQAKKMVAEVAQYNNTLTFEAASKNQAADAAQIENRLKALLTDIQSITQQATSLFNNLHASVGLTANGGTVYSDTPV